MYRFRHRKWPIKTMQDKLLFDRNILDRGSFRSKFSEEPIVCDLAPTGKALCYACREKIIKGTPRVWYKDKIDKKIILKQLKDKKDNPLTLSGLEIKRIFCYKCTPLQLNREYNKFERCLFELRKEIKKFKRSMKNKKANQIIKGREILEVLDESTKPRISAKPS